MPTARPRVAVIFGGCSPEHDVSIITGLQTLAAIDTTAFDPFPVYIDLNGQWYIGPALSRRETYIPSAESKRYLTPVRLDASVRELGVLHPIARTMFRPTSPIEFDIALPALHGLTGENGSLQGLFELINLPYTGMRPLAGAVFMDKIATKNHLRSYNIPLLPATTISKPTQGLMLDEDILAEICHTLTFPCCVKPRHLGSSIGVAKVDTPAELNAVLPEIFKVDTHAIAEPFVPNLVEYNIAVRRLPDGRVVTSAIEQPKCTEDLLDFRQKYGAGGKTGQKSGSTSSGSNSEGMLSLTRDINPKLPPKLEHAIRTHASTAFDALDGTGAPRVDFLCNSQTGEIWLNEINPTPGSMGYFLWEAAPEHSLLFTELLTHLLHEAQTCQTRTRQPADPVPEAGRLFSRA